MAEEKQIEKQEAKKQEQKKPEEKKARSLVIGKEETGKIIRILQTDIPGVKNIYAGLTRIKGVSWAVSNAICILNKIDKNRKIESLTKEEIHIIEDAIKNCNIPKFLLNRRKDFATGKDSHISGSDIDLFEELDIKRLKKIRSFRGLRHATGQPTRGQRTRSHFRTNRKRGVGVKTKKTIKTEGSSG